MSFRESILSIGSRMIQRYEDAQFEDMSYEELQQMQDNILQRIWMITLENDVYERYLSRYNPQCVKNIPKLLEKAKFTRRITAFMAPRASRMSFRASMMGLQDPGRFSITSVASNASISVSGSLLRTPSMLTMGTSGESSKITIAHRMVMARNEVDEMKKILEKFRGVTMKKKTRLRAEIEELEIRIKEIREAKEEFEEEIVMKGVDHITGKIPAEKIIRFVEEWLRSANTIIERLRLKSATLRMQIKKAKQQLIQREELGETLHAIDFEQLNIENQDYVKMIEEKNIYVTDMKKIAGHYHLKLTQKKQKLNNILSKLNEVKIEISSKQALIEKLKEELRCVQTRLKHTNVQLMNLITFVENHTAPEILEFVNIRRDHQNLEKSYGLLQRRRDIDRVIYQAYKKRMRKKNVPHFVNDQKLTRKVSDTRFPVQQIF